MSNNNTFGSTEPKKFMDKNFLPKHQEWVTSVLGEEKGKQYKNLQKKKQELMNQHIAKAQSSYTANTQWGNFSNVVPGEEEVNKQIRSLIVEARRKNKGNLKGGRRSKTRKVRKHRKGTRRH